MLRKVLFRAIGVKIIARGGVIRLNSEYSKTAGNLSPRSGLGKAG